MSAISRKLEDSAKIGSFMRGLMQSYERLRGQRPGSGCQFWDLVVISAGDTRQQAWYEAQLELKHQAGDLPLVPYHIIPDPPGPRIGSGGSTLHILRQLREEFGERLESWRVLLIVSWIMLELRTKSWMEKVAGRSAHCSLHQTVMFLRTTDRDELCSG